MFELPRPTVPLWKPSVVFVGVGSMAVGEEVSISGEGEGEGEGVSRLRVEDRMREEFCFQFSKIQKLKRKGWS